MTRMSGTQYIKKIKAQRAEQYQKTRELKVVMAKAIIDLVQGHKNRALQRLCDCLGFPSSILRQDVEQIIAHMQRAEQDEGEKDKA